MKKLLLLSLIIIGCQNTTQSNLPNPSDYSIFESPTEEDFERWGSELDTLWSNADFMNLPKLFSEGFSEFKDEEVKMLTIKYQDITYQYIYDFQKAIIDSTYYTFENLNKYETVDDYIETEFYRVIELSDDVDGLTKNRSLDEPY